MNLYSKTILASLTLALGLFNPQSVHAINVNELEGLMTVELDEYEEIDDLTLSLDEGVAGNDVYDDPMLLAEESEDMLMGMVANNPPLVKKIQKNIDLFTRLKNTNTTRKKSMEKIKSAFDEVKTGKKALDVKLKEKIEKEVEKGLTHIEAALEKNKTVLNKINAILVHMQNAKNLASQGQNANAITEYNKIFPHNKAYKEAGIAAKKSFDSAKHHLANLIPLLKQAEQDDQMDMDSGMEYEMEPDL